MIELILSLLRQIAFGYRLVEHLFNSLRFICQLLVISQAIVDVQLAPRQVADNAVFLVSFLASRVAQELRLADVCQTIALLHHRQHLLSQLLAELAGPEVHLVLSQPIINRLQILIGTVARIDAVHVPRHIQEEFYLILSRLDVAHVQNPELLDALVPSHRHLLIHERWREGAEPEVIVRTAPIAHVVVDAVATLAGTLCGSREVAHHAIIVVTPYQAHVLRHLQACMIHVEHLLVRHEQLRHLRHILIHIFSQ